MTSPWPSDWAQTSIAVVDAVALRSAAGGHPLVVSLDGRSGSGKSTLVSLVAGKTDSVVKTEATSTEPAPVIFLDGVYSSGPQMADLVGLSILVDAPNEQRPTRLAKREEPGFLAQWHARWDAVEAFYFSSVRPRESFDVIVTT